MLNSRIEPRDSSPLIVLITNNTASHFAGTERYVQQLGQHLIENGHLPIVYSTELGELAAQLRQQGILVVDDLREITLTPDIIHGHHHLDTACALTRFPGVPCLYFVHGVIPWEEHCFPDLDRIHRYVTVSRPGVRKACTEGIPPEKILTLPNFVDRRRFQRRPAGDGRRPDAERPRVLIFGNYPHAAEARIRTLCAAMGLGLHCAGGSYGGQVQEPEHLFASHDIVFAYGKSAMEALCCGCEVILSSQLGIGELITTANFQRLRDGNFGYTVCSGRVSEASVRGPLTEAVQRRRQGLGPVDEACIAALGSDTILPRLIALYREAIAAWAQRRHDHDLSQEFQVLSRYLRFLQISRFRALEAQLEEGRARQWELEQARTELAQAIQRLKTQPLRTVLGDRLQRWGLRRPAGGRIPCYGPVA